MVFVTAETGFCLLNIMDVIIIIVSLEFSIWTQGQCFNKLYIQAQYYI